MQKLSDLDLKQKRVMVRLDLNAPLDNGFITSDARLQAALPTIKKVHAGGAAVILVSHLGRPTEGQYQEQYSLAPIATWLTEHLQLPVRLEKNWIDGINIQASEVVLCENVRFQVGEKQNDESLSKKMAHLCDIFVMDAFATAHRAHASTVGISQFVDTACAGPLLLAELQALEKGLSNPQHPVAAIVGGSKISTKLHVLEHLLNKVDYLIPGGGIANTVLAALGLPIGESLFEPQQLDAAKHLLEKAKAMGVDIPIPTDVIVSATLSADAITSCKPIDDVSNGEAIFDIGLKTCEKYQQIIQAAKTIIWNGPVGVFEFEPFRQGTQQIAQAIAASSAFSLAGGGDTVAAIDCFGLQHRISYISTGGGAFLEFIEGKTLPAVAALHTHAKL